MPDSVPIVDFDTFYRDMTPHGRKLQAALSVELSHANLTLHPGPHVGRRRKLVYCQIQRDLSYLFDGGYIAESFFDELSRGAANKFHCILCYYWFHQKHPDNAARIDIAVLARPYGKKLLPLSEEPALKSIEAGQRLSGLKSRSSADEPTSESGLQPVLSGPRASDNRNHYSQLKIEVLGRLEEQQALRRFLNHDSQYSWFQLAGSGGQGKSRLAWDLIQHASEMGWQAGFVTKEEVARFGSTWSTWVPRQPTLLVFDYVSGNEANVGTALHELGLRGKDLAQKVRVLMIERQPWNQSGFREAQTNLQEEAPELRLELSEGIAYWFSRLPPRSKNRDVRSDRFIENDGVLVLYALPSARLVEIVHEVARLERVKIELPDDQIAASLQRVDDEGRPLYAVLLSRALVAGRFEYKWEQSDLLTWVLDSDRDARWCSVVGTAPPSYIDNAIEMNVAAVATMTEAINIAHLLRSEQLPNRGNLPSSEILRRALILTACPIAGDAGGPKPFVRGLEPDILGEWFVLSALEGGADFWALQGAAWRIAPKAMAEFLIRLAHDFPTSPWTRRLLEARPPDDTSMLQYGIAATKVFYQLRKRKLPVPQLLSEVLERAANADDPSANSTLGFLYHIGLAVERNVEQAVVYYVRARAKNDASATSRLAYCYFSAEGVSERDEVYAFSLWLEAATSGDFGPAMRNLGVCYLDGTGTSVSVKEAILWLQRAYEKGVESVAFDLALLFGDQASEFHDAKESFAWYRRAAKAGDAAAMVNLGVCYEKGDGVEKSTAEAVAWYHRAAEVGDATAMRYLGSCYENGDGVEKNAAEAVAWYRRAAEAGDRTVMLRLGTCYEHGKGVETNAVEAFVWYRRAAEAGNTTAMHYLGACYMMGLNVEKNAAEGVAWYRRAAETGDEAAMNFLSVIYLIGDGVEKNTAEAEAWKRRAVEASMLHS